MAWFGPQSGDCGCCGCGECADCCTDALPNSLDITLPTGWYEPTIDANKIGVNNLSGQTFNLQSGWPVVGACSGWIPGDPGCGYYYQDADWCQVDGYNSPCSLGELAIYAWFECRTSDPYKGQCRIRVRMHICGDCQIVVQGLTDYRWNTTFFPLGGITCSGLTKTGVWSQDIDYQYADSEGMCAKPLGGKNLTIRDGG
jgi:hypothetical protein